MKSYRLHLIACFVTGIFFFIGSMPAYAASSTRVHPDYNQKVQALKGKNVFKFELPDDKFLSIVGTGDDITAGNYIVTMNPLVDPEDPTQKLFYMVQFENHSLKQVALSDGRIVDFQNNSTDDYILTWRKGLNSIIRVYTAVYQNSTLSSARLQIGSNVRMEYDGQGNLNALYFGEGLKTKRLTYTQGQEIVFGTQQTQEIYSHSGRRLVHRHFREGTREPKLSEYDSEQKMVFYVARIQDGTVTSFPITLENITKYNVSHSYSSTGEIFRITTTSNVLGEIIDYKKEIFLSGTQPGEPQWKMVETDWQALLNNPKPLLTTQQPALPDSNSLITAQAAAANDAMRSLAIAAAEDWLALMDSGSYGLGWQAAAPYLKSVVSMEKFDEGIKAFRPQLGRIVSRQVYQAQYTTSLPAAPDGEYVVIQCATTFERKKSAIETLTTLKGSDGLWRVAGYYIK